MANLIVPKNPEYLSYNIGEIKTDDDRFELFSESRVIKLKDKHIFTGELKLILNLDKDLINKLKNTEHKLYALIYFRDTRKRIPIEIDFHKSESHDIFITRKHCAGTGNLSFIVVEQGNDLFPKEAVLYDNSWTIFLGNVQFESDFIFEWRDFSQYEDRYGSYDNLVFDVEFLRRKPSIYLNEGVAGLFDILTKTKLGEKKKKFQEFLSAILVDMVWSHLMLKDLINNAPIDSDESDDSFTFSDEIMRHFKVYFGNNISREEVVDKLASLYNLENRKTHQYDVLNELLFLRQERIKLADILARAIGSI